MSPIMTLRTLELSDVLKEDRLKPVSRIIRGESALDIISSSTPLGPTYSGEYKPAGKNWDDNQKYGEPDELEEQLKDIESAYAPEHPVNYASLDIYGANDLGDYLGSLDTLQDYYDESGRTLGGYLEGKGRDSYNIVGVGSSDLAKGAVAAVAIYGDDAALILGDDFEQDIERMVAHYNARGIEVTHDDMKRYVLDHEHCHTYQKGMDLDKLAKEYGLPSEEMAAEYDVETTLKGFYERQALASGDATVSSMYQNLAAVAADRAANVESNYGGYADAA